MSGIMLCSLGNGNNNNNNNNANNNVLVHNNHRSNNNKKNKNTSNNTANNNNNNDDPDDFNSWKKGLYSCRAPIASLDCMEEFVGGQEASPPAKELPTPTPPTPQPSPASRQGSFTPGLRYRNLGKSGLRVSNVGLGTWVTFGGQLSEEQAEEIVAAAYESGVNVFDLAEAYSGPRAELELGRILQRKGWRRASYIVITKIYWSAKSEERGLSRKHIVESVRNSLERLKLSYIDVVLVHKVDQMCPMEEVVRAMSHVISQGWAMYWGTARWTPVEVMEAYTNCRQFNCITPICEQCEYHMFCRDKSELYMTELYNKIGVGLMTWSPLSIGLISGKMEDGAPLIARPSFKKKFSSMSWTEDETQQSNKDNYGWNKERMGSDDGKRQPGKLRELALLAEKLGCSVPQLAIAWCLKFEGVQCLLLGASSVDQFYEHLQSLQLVPRLTSSLMAEVERLLDNKPVRPPMLSTLAQR